MPTRSIIQMYILIFQKGSGELESAYVSVFGELEIFRALHILPGYVGALKGSPMGKSIRRIVVNGLSGCIVSA